MTVPANHNTMPAKPAGRGVLVAKFAEKFGVDQDKLFGILKATCFKQPSGKNGSAPAEVSNEQMAALLVVADQYNLNPFTREIYAFPDKGKGIVPIVGVDGWARIINEHPAMDGFEFRFSPDVTQIDDDAKPCPEWCEAVIYRKDRSRPIVVREYLDECYRPAFEGRGDRGAYKVAGPWQSHTKRFLRHKALIQGARIAFGFAGVYDEDEAERISNARVVDMAAGMPAAIDVTDNVAVFESMAAQHGANSSALNAFLSETASIHGCTIESVKGQAVADFDGFFAAFQAWEAARRQQAQTAAQTRNKPTQAEMDQRREDAKAAVLAAGLALEDVEKELNAYQPKWTTAQCERAHKLAEKAMAQRDGQQQPQPQAQAAETVECPSSGAVVRLAVECAGCDQMGLCPATDGKD